MSSMLRQHHVRVQDLAAYMRGYDPSKPQSAEDWSKQESAFFEPGMVLFCLEKVSAPSGLALGKKDAEGETYRVKDMCVVVGRDDNKSLVVNITASAFELRYLEVLLIEKARKAILDGKDFHYVAAKPTQPLSETKVRELEQLGAAYAQGGSRRSLVVDPNGPQEPAMALLAVLGVRLQLGGIGKQLMDIGSICHMLYAPEGRAEDKNKQLVKACFLALTSEALTTGAGGVTPNISTEATASMAAEARKSRSNLPAQPFPNAGQWNAQDGANPRNTSSGMSAFNTPPASQQSQSAPPSQQSAWMQQPESAVPPPPVFNDSADAAGLNPFAPPPESQDDFASRFRQENQGDDAAMRTYEDKFAKEHEAKWGQGLNKFNNEQFGEHHFKTPDFGKKSLSQTRMPAFPQPGSKVPMGGAASKTPPPSPPVEESALDDVFQPPYHPSEQSEEGHIPTALKQQLDPNNQLFQDPDADAASARGDDPDGLDDEQDQPSPAQFGFDTSAYGSYEKTSMAMGSFSDDEIEPPQSAAQSYEEQASEFTAESVTAGLPPQTVHPDLLSQTADNQPFGHPSQEVEAPTAEPTAPPSSHFAPPSEHSPLPEVTSETTTAEQEPQHETASSFEQSAVFERTSAPAPEPEPEPEQPEEPEAEPAAGASLFERLNQQLSKGAVSDEAEFSHVEAGTDPFSHMDQEFAAPAEEPEPTHATLTADASSPAQEEPKLEDSQEESVQEPAASPPPPVPPSDFFSKQKNFEESGSSLFGHQSARFNWTKDEEAEEKPKPPHLQAKSGIRHLADSISDFSDFASSTSDEEPAKAQVEVEAAFPAPPALEPEALPVAEEAETYSQGAPESASVEIHTSTAENESTAAGADSAPRMTPEENPETASQESASFNASASTEAETVSSGKAPVSPAPESAKTEPQSEDTSEQEAESKRRRAVFTAAAKPFQEPRLVMNEMATLMSKLEIQVAKAAKKLGSRAEEISERLQNEVDRIVSEASEAEKENQKSITALSGKLGKQLDDSAEELRLKISDAAAEGRYKIKQLSSNNQDGIDESKNKLYESLKDSCKEFRIDTEELARSTERTLRKMVADRTIEMNERINAVTKSLDDTNDGYKEKLQARFARFKERMSDEAQSVVASLDRNVRSMVEEIEGSWDRASDKLKSTNLDLEQSIDHTVRTAELNLSQNTRKIMANTLMPRIKASKERLNKTILDCNRRFGEDSERQVSNQISGLDSSLNAARQQLQELVEECMNSIDSVGRGQQAGLEEIFKDTSSHAERATLEAMEMVKSTESKIVETEAMCKKLAETSSVDSDPQLTEERNAATARVQKLRQKATTELTDTIENGCTQLEQLSQKVQGELSTVRREQIDKARDAADGGLNKIKDAIHAVFNAIETTREKYME